MLEPSASRRQLLLAGASFSAVCALPRKVGDDSDADRFDRELERVEAQFPSQNVHRSNHVAMVVEALCVLGRTDAIGPWLDEHLDADRADARVSTGIDAERWRASLARPELFADWREFFAKELRTLDWQALIRTWGPRLVPGLAGAATHGVIRTAHAARSLVARDNELRRLELATALAYWAVNYQEFPWDGSVASEKSVSDALARVTPRRPAQEPPQGNIVTGLSALATTPSFRPVAGWIDVRDPARALDEMSSAFARLYLAHPERRIAFTHAITAPSALRLLAPYLDEKTVLDATRFAWQAAAGLYAVYGRPNAPVPEAAPARSRAELIARAVENGGAHAIKLTEACLREEALTHEPILFAAARDAGENMAG